MRLLHGSLFQYSNSPSSLVAFESCVGTSMNVVPPIQSTNTLPRNKCILLGGLSDGLLPVPYTEKLENVCAGTGEWSLVQPILSSSYLGFGNGNLHRDTKELEQLIECLIENRNAENGNIAIVGHSTGCQNAIHFMKYGKEKLRSKVKVIALQAPVSDREHAMTEDNYDKNIQHAKSLKSNGKENEMMPRDAFWAPITASRFLSLQDYNGDDDFFSSDLTEEEMVHNLGHIGQHNELRLLAQYGGKDEYVPPHVDKNFLLQRLCNSMNKFCPQDTRNIAIPLMLEKSNHNLSKDVTEMDTFIKEVGQLLVLESSQ